MKKKRILIILFAMILAFAIAGCDDKNKVDKEVSGDVSENETVTENKNATEKEETQKTDNKKNDTTTNKNESTSNKNETTTKPSTGNTDSNKKPSTGSTTKPNTGSTGNTGSTNNSGNTGNTQNNSTSTTTQPSTPVHEHKWTEVKETVVVQEAWVEDVYGWRTICGKCGLDMTEMEEDKWIWHVTVDCNSCYSAKYIKYDEINHPAVTEEQVTGYKCECGATKGK
ncbi:MAG: hypothetical protein IJA19_05840 [Clostridia bacterium]|nr:hypothetical protein [Clostridia bacterium]